MAIAAGVLMILIGFCGCCGSWFQSKFLLISYLTVIVTIMVLEITAGTLGYFFRHTIRDTLHTELIEGIRFRYSENDTNGMKVTWDQVQNAFNCCGVDHYQDWYNISAWEDKEWVPASCCGQVPPLNITDAAEASETSSSSSGGNVTEPVCGRNPAEESVRFKTNGCFKKIRHFILEHLHYVGLTCIVFAFIQFFSIVAALLVVCTMDYKRSRPRKGSSRPTYNRVPTL
jgi:tetraspanin-9